MLHCSEARTGQAGFQCRACPGPLQSRAGLDNHKRLSSRDRGVTKRIVEKIAAFDDVLADALRDERVARHLGDPTLADCEEYARRIRFHGIAGLLAARPTVMEAWPEKLREAVAAIVTRQAIWEETHREAIVPLIERLAQTGLESVLLKGTALAYSLYADPVMRPRGDTDLLVRRHELESVRQVFRSEGFERVGGAGDFTGQEIWQAPASFGVVHVVDLHWETHPVPAMRYIIDAEACLRDPASLPSLSPAAKAPHPVLLLVGGVINQATHARTGFDYEGARVSGAARLGWAYDNHLLLSALTEADCTLLIELCREKRIATSMLGALDFARQALGTVIPPMLDEVLQTQKGRPDITGLYFDQRKSHQMLLLDLQATRDWSTLRGVVHQHILPQRERLRQLHPEYPDWPLPLLHVRRLAGYLLKLAARGIRVRRKR